MNSDSASALQIAKNNRDQALLHGSLFAYLKAERKLAKVRENLANESKKKVSHGWHLKFSANGIESVPGARHRKWFKNSVACDAGYVSIDILSGTQRTCVFADPHETFEDVLYRYGKDTSLCWYTCGIKPVRLDMPLLEYLGESTTFVEHPRLRGGSNVDLSSWLGESAGGHCVPPTLELLFPKDERRMRQKKSITADAVELVRSARKIDHDVLAQQLRRRGRPQIQSEEVKPFFTLVDFDEHVVVDVQADVMETVFGIFEDDGIMEIIEALALSVDKAVVKILEDILFLCVGLFRSRDWKDIAYAVTAFVKLQLFGSLTVTLMRTMLGFIRKTMTQPDVQDLDETLKGVRDFRSFVNKWESIKESSFGKKFSTVLRYLTSFGLMTFLGLKPDVKTMRAAEENAASPWEKVGFLGALIDFASLTVERTIVFMKTGEWDSFIHGEIPYQEWYDEVQRLKRLSIGLGNLEAFGTTFHAYVGDLKEALEKGRAIVKFSGAVGLEKKIALNLYNDLEILNCNILSKKAAQQERRAPFGLLVFGGSSVAKSTFTRMLYLHFGKLRGLPVDDEYRYVRNASVDFWSGFNSQQWCVQMDDIGYLSSSKAMEDRSLLEIIQVINNVPFVPNQAELADKGKTPLRAELVVATSNAKDMNAPAYFHCPLAVQRRLPWVVTVSPKKEFARDDAPNMMDPLKIPKVSDAYPDIWNILVERVVPAGEAAGGKMQARHERVATFTDVNRFLDWYKETIFTFDQIQRKVVIDDEVMKSLVLCSRCSRVEKHCKCVKAEAPVKACVPEIQAGRSVEFPLTHKHKSPWTLLHSASRKTYGYTWSERSETYICSETCWNTGRQRAYAVAHHYPVEIQACEELPVLTTFDALSIAEEGMRHTQKGWLGSAIHFGLSCYTSYSWLQRGVTEIENLLKPDVQAGIVVPIPEGLSPGDSWTHEAEDARYEYSWARGQLYQTKYPRDGSRTYVAPVDYTCLPKPEVQESVVDMAQIIEESIRCSCTTDPAGTYILGKALIGGISLYHRYEFFRSVTHYALSFRLVRKFGSWFVDYVSQGSPLLRSIYVGVASVQEHMVKYGLAYKLLAGLIVAGAVWKGIKWCMTKSDKHSAPNYCDNDNWCDINNTGERPCKGKRCVLRDAVIPEKNYCDAEDWVDITHSGHRPCVGPCELRIPEVQGQRLAVDASHFTKSERENVWRRDDYETTTFDVTPAQGNYASLKPEQVVKAISRNSARIEVLKPDGISKTRGHALCVGGHLWVTCKHFFRGDADSFTIFLLFEKPVEGCSRNMKIQLFRKDMLFHATKDQVWFELRGVEVKKDITQLISTPTLSGTLDGYLVTQTAVTELVPNMARAILRVEFPDPADQVMKSFWRGYMSANTTNGDCGAPLLTHKPVTAIVGLHYMGGYSNYAYSTPLNQSDVREARERFPRPIIQSSEPNLSAPSAKKILGSLHHKSPLRWLETGTINVYGSFLGAHLKPRSRVRQTLLSDRIMEERGWTLDVGAPTLGDWRPWRHAYMDTCNQEHIVSQSDIDACVTSYVNDITARLRPEDLHNLQRLSEYDAINGIAGVKYIDKMNFNSSMGEPYNHSKKYHLLPMPRETAPEGKIFDEEVMERIKKLRATYESGKRGCSVFSGQQKDEARSLKKLLEGMIRIFTACSTELSVVVRELLLPFVKVFQENPLIFEGAPGAVCQSREWTKFRDYLTQFGVDKLIAGDYGKFDKKMLAEWILAAFEVIIRILMFAGWTDEECLPIWALAEDIAFPVVNMNGDLVMFFGSNPSGHPLTVIINCIVNALYMRYCYMKLSPLGDARCLPNFKKDVALLTYGDDNAAGSRVTWFNHTAIVEVLRSIGVAYTMADKESKSVPFIHIDDVSFLKRSWRWNAEANAFFCPLEQASIRKMLLIAMRSRTVTDEKHMADVIRAAHQEWFWYGKDVFELEAAYLKSLIPGPLEVHFDECPLPSWDELMARFHRASVGVEDFAVGELVELPEM